MSRQSSHAAVWKGTRDRRQPNLLLLRATPLKVRLELNLARHLHLEFPRQGIVFALIDQAELRAGSGRVGEKNGGRRVWGRDVVMDGVAFIVKVDGLDAR